MSYGKDHFTGSAYSTILLVFGSSIPIFPGHSSAYQIMPLWSAKTRRMEHGLLSGAYSIHWLSTGSNLVTLQRHQSASQTLSFLSITMPYAKLLSVGVLYRETSPVVRSHLAISLAQESDSQMFCLESTNGVLPCGGRLASVSYG